MTDSTKTMPAVTADHADNGTGVRDGTAADIRTVAGGRTIAAVATPYGTGGMAVIRISGQNALAVAERIFLPASGAPLSAFPPRTALYGKILKDGLPIDDGIATFFKGPASYTGEDTAELSCHGGILLASLVYQSALEAGAQPADPGEFTKQAFLNGKLSLSEAEAVMDLISAQTIHQLRLADRNRSGRIGQKTEEIYRHLQDLLAQVYVYIDYPDEDLAELSPGELLQALTEQRAALAALYDSYKTGRAVMEGIPTVIAGRPNTGKSSLLNCLLGKDRAIVSPVAGTTRDTVEETAVLGKVLLKLADTAGIHRTEDTVEGLGVQRSLEKLEQAELILAVFDGSQPAAPEDLQFIEILKNKSVPAVAILNKSDLPLRFPAELLDFLPVLPFSALTENGAPNGLMTMIEQLFALGTLDYTDAVLTSHRQAAAAKNALDSLDSAISALKAGFSADTAGLDVELAMEQVMEIDGKRVGEDIVSAIFSRFCVGK